MASVSLVYGFARSSASLSSRPGWTLSRRQRPRARSKANSVISVTRAWGPPRRRGSLGVGTGGADEVR